MKFSPRNLISGGALSLITMFAIGGLAMTAAAAPPSIQSEEAAHPRIVDAIHHMREALHEMEAAPDDFGGNKAAAIRDTKVALHSLRKALYFRLHMDDAAIDRME
jgi:hypothetical protein